jgi:response regulator NasT
LSIANTRIAGFVGTTQKGPMNVPTRLQNWDEFVETYGYMTDTYTSDAVFGFFQNGGNDCWINRVAHMPKAGETEGPTRVVVAEDEVLIRLDLVEMLTEEGYDVVGQAGDGEAAVELTTDLRPDLVVMDVKMPKLDGISAAEKIASERIAPVVMLTAFSQRELVDRARQAGAMAYVVKPFGKADLIPAIEIARARFAEITAVEAEVEDLTERLESRKAVDRAKGMLQTGLGLTEPEAFRWIQKTAMDLRKSMREVAEGVIEHGAGAKKK